MNICSNHGYITKVLKIHNTAYRCKYFVNLVKVLVFVCELIFVCFGVCYVDKLFCWP